MSAAQTNPFRAHPAYKRAINEILDAVEKNNGVIPHERTIRSLSSEDVRKLRHAFWPKHVEVVTDDSVKIHPRRVIRDLYDDDAERAISTWYDVVDRVPRSPKKEREALFASLLGALRDRHDPAASYLRALIEERKGWPSRTLEGEGIEVARIAVEQFLTVVDHLPCERPTRIRTFSAAHLASSKSLDAQTGLYRRVADYFIDMDPDLAVAEEEISVIRRQAMEKQNLVENPASSIVLVHGPLALDMGEVRLQTALRNGTATALTYQQIEISSVTTTASALLTVENETPFYELAKISPASVLLVCTRGQPNTAVLRLLRSIPRSIPLFHWGDIDSGGFRILAAVQRVVSARPLLMDELTLRARSEKLVRLDDDKRANIERTLSFGENAALRAALEMNGWLEQESIPVEEVLEHLRRQTA